VRSESWKAVVMAWLEAHQELRSHPKTKRAARLLGIGRPQMIGHMFCLWWWCLDYAQTGNLANFDHADIADAAGWDGDPDLFIEALVNCGTAGRPGFLVDKNGNLSVNDWAEYGGRYIAKRDQGRERQRQWRLRNAKVTHDESVSDTPVTRYERVSNAEVRVSNASTGENRREQERTGENRREQEPETATPLGAGAPTAPPKPTKRVRKDKPEVPEQVTWFRSVIGRFPPKELYPKVIEIVSVRRDADLLQTCWAEWIGRGYNRVNYAWLLDWYKNGHIPPARTAPNRNGNSNDLDAQNEAHRRRMRALLGDDDGN